MSKHSANSAKDTYPGIFITFEGGEGVGKTTQIQLLAEKLQSHGFGVTISREPGGTSGAEAVRHVLLEAGAAEPFGPSMEAVLFAAARNDHVEQVIKPALRRGDIVLVDRFLDSTRVYQGVSGQLDPDFVSQLERVAIAGLMPDQTIVLDLPSREGLQRAAIRRQPQEKADRFEKEDIEIHEKRRQAFLKIANDEPERVRVISATGKTEEIAQRIWAIVGEYLAQKGLLPTKPHATDDLKPLASGKEADNGSSLATIFSNQPKAGR